jgi:hypothetical protein
MRFTAGPPGGSGRGGVARAADIPVRCHADTTSCMIMELYAKLFSRQPSPGRCCPDARKRGAIYGTCLASTSGGAQLRFA